MAFWKIFKWFPSSYFSNNGIQLRKFMLNLISLEFQKAFQLDWWTIKNQGFWAELCPFLYHHHSAKEHSSCKWRILLNEDPSPIWIACYQIWRKNMVVNIYKYWLQSSPLELKKIVSWFYSNNTERDVSVAQCTVRICNLKACLWVVCKY